MECVREFERERENSTLEPSYCVAYGSKWGREDLTVQLGTHKKASEGKKREMKERVKK